MYITYITKKFPKIFCDFFSTFCLEIANKNECIFVTASFTPRLSHCPFVDLHVHYPFLVNVVLQHNKSRTNKPSTTYMYIVF